MRRRCSSRFPRAPNGRARRSAGAHASPRRAQVFERRYRQTVRSVDLWSVLKISLCFYLCALIVMLVTGVMLWWIASAVGAVHNIEQLRRRARQRQGVPLPLVGGAARRDAHRARASCACSSVITVLAAAFYNLFSELIGGIEVTVVEHEDVR